ncbi:MAG: universal stress protein [Opitutaceae bacterium]|nr:universal stress protein [Opitutaceae bacterium]MBP9913123.1 universal stress protein [Opitutaceae bacterium]
MKTVLVPIDFSPVSNPVVKAAVALAKALKGRLVLLHAVQPPIITSEYGAVMTNIQEIIAISEKVAARALTRQQRRLEAGGLKVTTVLVTGGAVPHILEQAAKYSAAYIVMGSHGHSALYELFAGSTTTGVLKKSPCPVVVVPPARKKTARK